MSGGSQKRGDGSNLNEGSDPEEEQYSVTRRYSPLIALLKTPLYSLRASDSTTIPIMRVSIIITAFFAHSFSSNLGLVPYGVLMHVALIHNRL